MAKDKADKKKGNVPASDSGSRAIEEQSIFKYGISSDARLRRLIDLILTVTFLIWLTIIIVFGLAVASAAVGLRPDPVFMQFAGTAWLIVTGLEIRMLFAGSGNRGGDDKT